MKLRYVTLFAAAGCALALSAPTASAQHDHDHHGHDHGSHEGHDHGSPGEHMPSPEEMARWMKTMTPGEKHEVLQTLAGDWSWTMWMRMGPGAPKTESSGTSHSEAVLGGRFLVDHVEGPSPFGEFEGMGIMGYDNMKGKYVQVWMDSMGTGMMTSEGTADASGKVITMSGEYTCPMSGQEKRAKSVLRLINDDKYVLKMYDYADNGEEYQHFELVATRK